ncbi:MAG: hypothetical protein QOE60_2420 [Thermoleophilaceae bacterium]|nr:hypothetical protein [Thermoleophilaceae bacterium]
MSVEHLFAGIPVADLDAALAWYERLWGRAPDLVPNDNEGCWQVAESRWIYVVGDAERAGNALLTFLVDDLDGWVAELAARGLETGSVEAIAAGTRTTAIADPEGNRLTFAQVPQD